MTATSTSASTNQRPRPAVAAGINSQPSSDFPAIGPVAGFATTLAGHAMTWHQRSWTDTQLAQAITCSAVALVPDAHGAAILVQAHPGEITVGAAYGVLPDLNLPAAAGAGAIKDLPSPESWPLFTTPAGPDTTVLCTPLGHGHTMFGTLIVATDHHDAPDPATTEMLTMLAMHASNALAAAHDRANLHDALTTRDVIGQAKGILMERRHITADIAFTELIHLSQISNTKLRDLCTHITDTGEIPRPPTKPTETALQQPRGTETTS